LKLQKIEINTSFLGCNYVPWLPTSGGFLFSFSMNYHLREKTQKRCLKFYIEKIATSYINPVLVYVTSALFTISILGVRDCSFCFNFLERHYYRTLNSNPLAVTLENCKLALLVGEKKRKTENVDHFCVFFNFFFARESR